MRHRFVIVGNGKMLTDCARILRSLPEAELALIIFDERDAQASRIRKQCERDGIRHLAVSSLVDDRALGELGALTPEWIFNINSFWIFREPLLSLPERGIVNFHNGPLPRYRGVHIPTWAIANGERRHGVTWHLVEAGIDTGPILVQRLFDIDDRETAISLTFRCILEGTELFRENASKMLRGEIESHPQERIASYFFRRDIPNGGWLDFEARAVEVDRFVRALDFRPFPSDLPPCRVRCAGGAFSVYSVALVSETRPAVRPGTLLTIEGGLHVAVQDGVVRLEELGDGDGEEADVRQLVDAIGLRAGQVLGQARRRRVSLSQTEPRR